MFVLGAAIVAYSAHQAINVLIHLHALKTVMRTINRNMESAQLWAKMAMRMWERGNPNFEKVVHIVNDYVRDMRTLARRTAAAFGLAAMSVDVPSGVVAVMRM
jgi:hypothetical protein